MREYWIGKDEIERHVLEMNKESVDIMILSGDMADGSPKIVSGALQPIITKLKTKFGVYFSTGETTSICMGLARMGGMVGFTRCCSTSQ